MTLLPIQAISSRDLSFLIMRKEEEGCFNNAYLLFNWSYNSDVNSSTLKFHAILRARVSKTHLLIGYHLTRTGNCPQFK